MNKIENSELIKKVLKISLIAAIVLNILSMFIHNYTLSMILGFLSGCSGWSLIISGILYLRTLGRVKNNGYYDLALHTILCLITCGIWYFIWIYKTTDYLNNYSQVEYRNPRNKLLLCMLVPFYSIYWIYTTASMVDKIAKDKGIQSDISVVCLILAFFIGIVPPIIIQNKINTICLNKNVQKMQENKLELGYADEIRKYKDLLDNGIITQEEFEKKKNQLLDL